VSRLEAGGLSAYPRMRIGRGLFCFFSRSEGEMLVYLFEV
jgi:hypothetical protein